VLEAYMALTFSGLVLSIEALVRRVDQMECNPDTGSKKLIISYV